LNQKIKYLKINKYLIVFMMIVLVMNQLDQKEN